MDTIAIALSPFTEAMPALYIVRAGAFGGDLTPRLWLLLLALGLLAWDSLRLRRLDYVWVLLTGCVVWTMAEAFLQGNGVRNIGPQTLYGATIPQSAVLALQGAAEGAAVAVLGLFVGDRLLSPHTRPWAALALGTACILLLTRSLTQVGTTALATTTAALSRRNVLAPIPLLFLGALALLVLVFAWARPAHRRRLTAMALATALLAAAWTAAQVIGGLRWVEQPGPAPGLYLPATPAVAAVVLTFDVVVEITLAYAAFYVLPAWAGRIGSTPLPAAARSPSLLPPRE